MTNAEMSRHWAGSATGWVENERIFDAIFAPVTAAILDSADVSAGQRVLDVGCGTGTLLAAVTDVGAAGVGVDISPGMVAAAATRVPNATVLLGDAQVMDLAGEAPGKLFDRVVSRFGVMFFADPVAAFANLRRVAADDARLVFGCWRAFDENPMFTLGTSVLAEQLDPRPGPPEPNAPGPTAFADRGRLVELLSQAGWTSLDIRPLDVTLDYGFDATDGVEYRLATILSTTAGRTACETLQPTLTPEAWADLLDDVRAELRRHLVDGAVRMPGAVWLVTASNPR